MATGLTRTNFYARPASATYLSTVSARHTCVVRSIQLYILYCRKTVGLYSDQIFRYGEQNHILPPAFIASHGNRPASRTFKLCHIPLLIGSNHSPAIGTVHLSGNPFEILAFGVHSVQSPFFRRCGNRSLLYSLGFPAFVRIFTVDGNYFAQHEHFFVFPIDTRTFVCYTIFTNRISCCVSIIHEHHFVVNRFPRKSVRVTKIFFEE